MQYIGKMTKKREILYNFWLTEKIQKHMKLNFLTKERKKERKAKIGGTSSQNNVE